jgi:hypothetical protein
MPLKIVELQLAVRCIADDGVIPAWQTQGKAGFLATEELYDFVGRGSESESATGGMYCRWISNLRFDLNNV